MQHKPYAESSEQNKDVILEVLEKIFTQPGKVLEIGSGTGQHAVYFAEKLPHLHWHPTDIAGALPGIQLWLADSDCDNLADCKELDLGIHEFPVEAFDYVFTANTVHIVSWPLVKEMFEGAGKVLKPGGRFAVYGPFSYGGQFTSESNAQFDQWLKRRDPASGVRNFEDLVALAEGWEMSLVGDFEMPVNNRVLVWGKR